MEKKQEKHKNEKREEQGEKTAKEKKLHAINYTHGVNI